MDSDKLNKMNIRRMRVLHLIHNFKFEGPGGGISRFGIDLCQHLNNEQIKVILCGLGNYQTESEFERMDMLQSKGIEAFTLSEWGENHPYKSYLYANRNLQFYIKKAKINIIHSHSEFSDIAALTIKPLRKKIRLIRTVHYGYKYEWKKRPFRRVIFSNFLIPLLYDKEVGVSMSITTRLNNRHLSKLLGKKAIYISSAIELERFSQAKANKSAIRTDLKIPKNSAIVGTIGRITEQKGYTYLIHAVSLVLSKFPDVYFLIIGDGELLPQLKYQAIQLGVNNNIRFLGGRSNIEDFLACMDLFVSSSLWEGLPASIMESMAAGIPIIATDVDGNRDLIENEVTGWLVPPYDFKALAKAIINALHSTDKNQEMVEKAKSLVQDYSMETIARKYQALYLS
ncbi:glycosyltransferase family 4 protein [Chloroflexota bacterium]